MLDSIYVGLSGLTGYARGLNNISNNVANLNTPGFKSSQMQFTDLFYRYQNSGGNGGNGSSYAQGSGVSVGSNSMVLKQGELRATGNDQDVGLEGNGLFVLRKDNEVFYTRAGQFVFDADGYLVSRDNQARVAALDGRDTLRDINISGLRSNPPKVTSLVKLGASLSSNDTSFTLKDLVLHDSLGAMHTLTIDFENNKAVTTGSWLIEVKEGENVISSGEIRYQGDGSALADFNSHTFTYTPVNGANPVEVKLDFTKTNNFSSAASSLNIDTQDGFAAGSLTKATFDIDGYLVLAYSNGQTVKQDRLALAWFNHMQGLELAGGNMLINSSGQQQQLGSAGSGVFGKVKGGSIELSNVDLAQQFSELIITQRGYQASSQIITASNEMIQQLFDIRGKR
ncbi:MAG: flagellar hook-basal body complex protein [Pseudomonadota bacterium]